ncbi:hypothetical protein Q4485_02715 [Granulosicoccaceae sp. 1_MG-2023]|nr:hypothetical protein [Granulosicoccaceae sp. 1_MG-2023]
MPKYSPSVTAIALLLTLSTLAASGCSSESSSSDNDSPQSQGTPPTQSDDPGSNAGGTAQETTADSGSDATPDDNTSNGIGGGQTGTEAETPQDTGSETDSSETDSSETDSSETDSSETDSSETDSSETDSSETDSSETDSSETDSSETDSSETDSSETDGSETDGSETDGSETDGSEADGSEADGSEADSSETDSSETDSSETDGSETDGSEADSTEADSSETDSADSGENTSDAPPVEDDDQPVDENTAGNNTESEDSEQANTGDDYAAPADCSVPTRLFDGVDADYQVPVEFMPHLTDDESCAAQTKAYLDTYGEPEATTHYVTCPGPMAAPGWVYNNCEMYSTYHYTCAGYSIGFSRQYMTGYCQVSGNPMTEEHRLSVEEDVQERKALQEQTGAPWQPLFIADFDGHYYTVFQTVESARTYHDLHYAIHAWEDCYHDYMGVTAIADEKIYIMIGDFPADTIAQVDGEYAISPDGSLFLNPEIISLTDDELRAKVQRAYAYAQFLAGEYPPERDFNSNWAATCVGS